MTQIVKFPDEVFARLATIADKRNMRIADLIVEGVNTALSPAPKPVVPQSHRRTHQALDWDEVARLHGQGMNDRQIADAMGRNQKSVYTARTAMKLPRNAEGKWQRKINPKEGNA